MMILEISKNSLVKNLQNQLNLFFTLDKSEQSLLNINLDIVLNRCDICFSGNKNKYYSKNGKTYFNPYHSGQYTIFLYYFSNSFYNIGETILADKLYYLNKIMNGCDLFYEVELPEIFILDHPVGTVMGRAKFKNYFSFGQNCTVGNNKGIFPEIGENVAMSANSLILGKSKIGNNVTLGAGTCIKDQDVPDNSIVFGNSPDLIIKPKKS